MLQEGKIILRDLLETDQASLAELANNKKVSDYLRDYFPFPYTIKDAEIFIHLKKDENPQMTFAIEFEGHFCGVITFLKQTDIYRRSVEIGYWLGEPYWNKGILTTAVRLMTDYGFNQLNFIRIFAGIFETNIASIRVLEKNGYVREGVFKKSIFKHGQVWDEYRFAITK